MLVYVLKQRWHHLKYPSIYHITSCSPDTLISSDVTLKHWDWEKWPLFYRRNFQMEFGESKCLNFEKNLSEICSPGPLSIGADNTTGDKPLSETMMVWFTGTHLPPMIQQNTVRLSFRKHILQCRCKKGVKLLRPSDAYMHRWTMATLVQIMPCRLNGAKPLSEPMLAYCQLQQTSVKL